MKEKGKELHKKKNRGRERIKAGQYQEEAGHISGEVSSRVM